MALTILGISFFGISFFGLLVLGVPVAFEIGLLALCSMLYEGLPLAVLFQQMMSGMNVFPGWAGVARAAAAAAPGLLIVVIILTGILSGVFTATEAASIAVIYTLLLTFLIYRTMDIEHLLLAAAKAVKTTGVVLLLIGVSAMFQYLMGLYEVAGFMGEMISGISTTPWVVFLLINLILFVLGTFMDMAATILIATPIFLPIAMKYGMDPVQFGMVMLINCALGLNTPPVGTTQFVGCAIGEISVGAVMKTIWPFYGALLAALMLVTYVPSFSLALPRLLMGYAH